MNAMTLNTHSDTHTCTHTVPSVEQIKNYFVQSEIYAIVIQHIGVISMDDRSVKHWISQYTND